MSTALNIQLSSILQPQKLQVDFMLTEEWTSDSEALLFQKIHDVLSVIRDEGTSLRINLDISVRNPAEAIFRIKKILQQHKTEGIQQHKLSIREIEILGLIMLGYTNLEIAEKLFISYETVKSHRKNILMKTGARNTAALINYYHQTFFDK
jgi:DNA-binding CsgD family transcriptional regulator